MRGPHRGMGVKAFAAGSLVFLLPGCFFGMYLPSSVDVELTHASPSRGSVTDIRTLVVASPSASESLTGLPDSSRGKLDQVGIELAEQLEKSGRFTIIPPSQYLAALASSRKPPSRTDRNDRMMTDAERLELIREASRAVKADGIIVLQGKWERSMSLGKVTFGRPQYKRQLAMSLVATSTGETVWYQEVTATIEEGISLPSEEAIREPVVQRLAEHFLATAK